MMIARTYSESVLVEQRKIVDSTLKMALELSGIERKSVISEQVRLLTKEEMSALHLISHRAAMQVKDGLRVLISTLGIVGEARTLNYPGGQTELWIHPISS